MPKRKKSPNSRKKKSFLDKLKIIDDRFGLFDVFDRSMPIILLSTSIMLFSVLYLKTVSFTANTDSLINLPQTGDDFELSDNFVFLYPEQYSSISLPDTITGISKSGFFQDTTSITFYARDSLLNLYLIGEATKDSEDGTYTVTWDSAPDGQYAIWAEIVQADGSGVRSEAISVTIY